ncbi:hypothetical protein R3P38DRAFT_2423491, partial [Favolaschia claudopus]
AGVHDGVAVRNISCRVHECSEPLPTQKSRFCLFHSYLDQECYINGCANPVESGFSTCRQESHRAHELQTQKKNKAMFQLHNRL